jgi:hypothetical protein
MPLSRASHRGARVPGGMRNNVLEAQGSLVLYIAFFKGVEAMPEGEASGDYQTDSQADQEEDAIGGQRDEQGADDDDSDEEGGGTLQAKAKAGTGFGRHPGDILALRVKPWEWGEN